MTINWAKTKIHYLGDLDEDIQHATVQGNQVEVVESFTYLGSLIHCSGSSKPEIKREANFVHEAMFVLDQNVWRSNITLKTKLRLYNTRILPIYLYGAETWSVTATLSKKIDAMDNWCLRRLRRILNIHWTELITIDEDRSRTGQPFLSDIVHRRRLSFYSHLNRANPWQDHHRALQACNIVPPVEWRRRTDRPRQTWLRTVETDLRPMNLGLTSAKRCAQDKAAWRQAPEEVWNLQLLSLSEYFINQTP